MSSLKNFFILAVLLCICFNPSNVWGQQGDILNEEHPYYDTIQLFEIIKDNNVEKDEITKVIFILEKYLPEEKPEYMSINNLKNAFSGNSFVVDYLNIIITLSPSFITMDSSDWDKIRTYKMGSKKIGSFGVGTLTEGLAKFLVERAKSELSIAFFERFKRVLEKEKFKALRLLFPSTNSALQTINKEIYNFSAYLQVLREGFKKDLSDIITNIPKLLEIEKIKNFFNNNKALWVMELLKNGLEIIKGITDNKHPGDILADLNLEKFSSQELINLKNTIKLLQIISNSLRANNSSQYWINADSFKKLFEKYEYQTKTLYAYKIYLGLIYQETFDIEFKIKGEKKDDKPIIKRFANDLLGNLQNNQLIILLTKIERFLSKTKRVQTSLDELESLKKQGQKPEIDYYYKFFNEILEMFNYSSEFYNFALKTLSPSRTEELRINYYLEIARKLWDVYFCIKQENYSLAIIELINIIESKLPEKISKKIKEDPTYKSFTTLFLKYSAFMAAVVRAENSDEVKKAIEAAALPVGSYRIKRTKRLTISLNSYLGLFCNQEKFLQQNSTDTTNPEKVKIWNFSITAPIGLAFNWGINTKKYQKRPGLCLSVFASIIDLGAIVRFHFKNDKDIEGLSELEWKDIFAPGAFLLFNLNRLPISFGGGVQLAPMLKEVNEDGILEMAKTKRIRWGLMVVVDIPLIHFK